MGKYHKHSSFASIHLRLNNLLEPHPDNSVTAVKSLGQTIDDKV